MAYPRQEERLAYSFPKTERLVIRSKGEVLESLLATGRHEEVGEEAGKSIKPKFIVDPAARGREPLLLEREGFRSTELARPKQKEKKVWVKRKEDVK